MATGLMYPISRIDIPTALTVCG